MDDFVMHPISRVEVGSTKYEHHFGGMNRYAGMTPSPNAPKLHLIYDLDTRDPLVPVKIPGIRRLPLCFGFAFNASALAYRLKSDSEVELIYVEDSDSPLAYPYDPYPEHFELVKVRLLPISYEQHKLLVYHVLFAHDSPGELLSAKDAAWLEQARYPFTQLGGMHQMWQGVPEASCRNRECDSYQTGSEMKVFAVIWNNPVPGVALWDPDIDDGGDSQIIYQICRDCHTIHVCNRCT